MKKKEMIRYIRRELDIWDTALGALAALVPEPERPGLKLVFTIPAEPRELISRYSVGVDDLGRARFTPHESIAILEKIDVGRIRRCVVCAGLFWAGRIDKATCSPKCGNVWRQRKFRDPGTRSKYKQNRIRAENLKDKKGGKK